MNRATIAHIKKKIIDSNQSINTIKTTDINILLNRVRIDKKKELKKKFIFVCLLLGAVVTLIVTTTLF